MASSDRPIGNKEQIEQKGGEKADYVTALPHEEFHNYFWRARPAGGVWGATDYLNSQQRETKSYTVKAHVDATRKLVVFIDTSNCIIPASGGSSESLSAPFIDQAKLKYDSVYETAACESLDGSQWFVPTTEYGSPKIHLETFTTDGHKIIQTGCHPLWDLNHEAFSQFSQLEVVPVPCQLSCFSRNQLIGVLSYAKPGSLVPSENMIFVFDLKTNGLSLLQTKVKPTRVCSLVIDGKPKIVCGTVNEGVHVIETDVSVLEQKGSTGKPIPTATSPLMSLSDMSMPSDCEIRTIVASPDQQSIVVTVQKSGVSTQETLVLFTLDRKVAYRDDHAFCTLYQSTKPPIFNPKGELIYEAADSAQGNYQVLRVLTTHRGVVPQVVLQLDYHAYCNLFCLSDGRVGIISPKGLRLLAASMYDELYAKIVAVEDTVAQSEYKKEGSIVGTAHLFRPETKLLNQKMDYKKAMIRELAKFIPSLSDPIEVECLKALMSLLSKSNISDANLHDPFDDLMQKKEFNLDKTSSDFQALIFRLGQFLRPEKEAKAEKVATIAPSMTGS